MKKFLTATFLAATLLINTAIAFASDERAIIYQIAPRQSFAMGYFDGSITVGELKNFGDTGLGSFDKLNGDMILLDGVAYRANPNCNINVVDDKIKLAFGNVAFFALNSAGGGEMYRVHGMKEITDALTRHVGMSGLNSFYMVKLHGDFNEILLCAAREQSKPYPTLAAVMQTQTEVTFKNVSGTLVCVYCPEFIGSLNSAGWHIHFISDDKKIGGHVLEMNLEHGTFEAEKIDELRLLLPTDENFQQLNLTGR